MARFISWIISLTLAGILFAAFLTAIIFYFYGAGLPDYKTLKNYEPPVVSRLYSNDGHVFAEYAHEKRIYVPLSTIPLHVRQAFLSAEDKNFYSHFGVDIPSIFAATLTNIKNIGASRRPIGASTITQQVAKNFLLLDISHMVSIERKIKEAILSLRIERAYTKDYILELYLNEVYLGNRSYGLAAAALNYFNKSLSEITIAEAAFFAALPKAPSRYHPVKNPKATYGRRNWVIGRMLKDGVITEKQARDATAERIILRKRHKKDKVRGNYFAEEVRRELMGTYGKKSVYQDGYVIRTSLDPRLQKIAETTLRDGLENYDRKHGWRGPIAHINLLNSLPVSELSQKKEKGKGGAWLKRLRSILRPAGSGHWTLAIVLEVQKKEVLMGNLDGSTGYITLKDLKWARRWLSDESRGPGIRHPKQVLRAGDIVLVEPVWAVLKSDQKKESLTEGSSKGFIQRYKGLHRYYLRQIPVVSGAIVAMDPATGRVLAMQGGYDFEMSQFNRATQAKRQTGSAFKPFAYIAAFEKGLTPSTVLEDIPFAIDIGYGQDIWRPKNWDEKFKGPITLRRSFELSRNVAAIRMIHEQVGMKNVVDVARRFDVDKHMPVQLSGILGASETTLLRLTAAYAMIANGGKHIIPTFLDHIQNRHGETVLKQKYSICKGCDTKDPTKLPILIDVRKQVTDPISAYQMTSLLRGAVERGLGEFMKSLPHQLVVKSGTTNDYRDAWMMGYSPTLVLGVYIGFDTPRTLGIKQYGSKVAGPIFKAFMKEALKNKPVIPFKIPRGVKMVKVNAFTGGKAEPGKSNTIYEAFRPGTEVTESYNLPQWDNPNEQVEEGAGGYPKSPFGPKSPYGPPAISNGNPYSYGGGISSGPSNDNTVSGTGGLY